MSSDGHPFDRLVDACERVRSPVCVGLDPHLDQLPPELGAADDPTAASRRFCFEILEALEDVVPAIKPQIAFFEQMGPDGVRLYFDVIREAHRRGFFVIGDIKRSDIGSTAAAYARAHLGPDDGSAADVVTVNPYLGIDGVRPFLEVGRPHGRGVIVLVRTSNPSAAELQDLHCDGQEIYRHVGRLVTEWGSAAVGRHGFSDVGAVVGATRPAEAARLRGELPTTFFLVPGFGAQGGTVEDIVRTFHSSKQGALISSSRGVLFAYRDQPESTSFALAAREAALEMSRSILQALESDDRPDAS
jgi:orotidine-5'-phosphate decarboxylase